ncbi:class I SAM-dependent methyltransferase [Streptomyces sp. NPDC057456]|uniref:class I SAM-dependent methyltransferase n=1 Tax=Streptomyces sp. NPDC057456 TaxID=3346139 RepID=UPI0036900076
MVDLLPLPGVRAMDVGAGTGRDAAALARRGYEVTAVEPVRELADVARHLNPHQKVRWVQDALPDLGRLTGGFSLVLLSAVWMHLPPAERGPAMRRLAELLTPDGLLVISLRRGKPPTDRVMFDVPAQEVTGDAQRAGLEVIRLVEEGADRLGRAEVWWQTLALGPGKR